MRSTRRSFIQRILRITYLILVGFVVAAAAAIAAAIAESRRRTSPASSEQWQQALAIKLERPARFETRSAIAVLGACTNTGPFADFDRRLAEAQRRRA